MATQDARLESPARHREPRGVSPAVQLASQDRAARDRAAKVTNDAVRRWLQHLKARSL